MLRSPHLHRNARVLRVSSRAASGDADFLLTIDRSAQQHVLFLGIELLVYDLKQMDPVLK